VLGHLPEILGYLGTVRRETMALRAVANRQNGRPATELPGREGREGRRRGREGRRRGREGREGRAASLSAALLVGLVMALALVPQFAAWTH
jgi:hypothetical protein